MRASFFLLLVLWLIGTSYGLVPDMEEEVAKYEDTKALWVALRDHEQLTAAHTFPGMRTVNLDRWRAFLLKHGGKIIEEE